MASHIEQSAEAGPSTIVAAIIGYLPGDTEVEASTSAWHAAFYHVRNQYKDRLPQLAQLRYYERPGFPPISNDLEDILENIAMWDMSAILNPRLMVRKQEKEQLREITRERIAGKEQLIEEAALHLRSRLVEEAALHSRSRLQNDSPDLQAD